MAHIALFPKTTIFRRANPAPLRGGGEPKKARPRRRPPPPSSHRRELFVPIPAAFEGRLSIPAVAAPMFVTSGPDLVVEACRAGIVGTFPALNQRTSESYEAWLLEISEPPHKIRRDPGKVWPPFGGH